MEDGISNAGGVLIVNDNNHTLDKTWKEINDAFISGKTVLIKEEGGSELSVHQRYRLINNTGMDQSLGTSTYSVYVPSAGDGSGAITYTTDSETGYPHSAA